MKRLLATTCLVHVGITVSSAAAGLTSSHTDFVLGTSLDISISGVDSTQADKTITIVRAEIARLEKLFSPKSDQSELARINRAKSPVAVSPDMIRLLENCQLWEDKTGNMLNCQLGSLQKLWQDAVVRNIEPDRIDVRKFTHESLSQQIRINPETGQVTRPEALLLDPTALAKGYILDRALEQARAASPNATGIKIDLGGDAVYWGTPDKKASWLVGIADPFAPSDNGDFLTALSLNSLAIASSGHNSRSYTIGRRSFSQILSPRDGWPVENAPAATVVAPDAMTADALATALTTMPIHEGLKLVNSLKGIEALIVAPDRRQFPSKDWHKLVAEKQKSLPTVWQGGKDFTIAYEIPDPQTGNYKSPYLSIWVTDSRKKLVRSLLLLGKRTRWMEENYVWWRRFGRKYDSIIDGISRPTRLPGHYNVNWDGRDDFGGVAGEGDYILHIEAAREHGGHDYRQIPLTLGAEKLILRQAAEGEIGALTLQFKPRG